MNLVRGSSVTVHTVSATHSLSGMYVDDSTAMTRS